MRLLSQNGFRFVLPKQNISMIWYECELPMRLIMKGRRVCWPKTRGLGKRWGGGLRGSQVRVWFRKRDGPASVALAGPCPKGGVLLRERSSAPVEERRRC